MNINYETAQALNISVKRIFEEDEDLIELLEEFGGKYRPQYDPDVPASLGIAHGLSLIHI